MEKQSVIHSSFVIERSYAAASERVFALSDPAKKRRWYIDGDLDVEGFDSDFRVGGRECARFRFKAGSPSPGATLANDTVYQDIVPNRRIILAYTMSIDGRRFSASPATFELLPNGEGTNLIFTEQGAFFEGADRPQMRQDGWTKLLANLARVLSE